MGPLFSLWILLEHGARRGGIFISEEMGLIRASERPHACLLSRKKRDTRRDLRPL